MNRLHGGYPDAMAQSHHVVRCHQDQQQPNNRLMPTGGQQVVMAGADGSTIVVQQQPASPAQGPNHPAGQVLGPGGQFINVQANQSGSQQGQIVSFVNATGTGAGQQGQGQQHQQQHRVFINGQPTEPSGPGRPNRQMIPVTVSNQPANQEMRRGAQNQPQNMQNIQFYTSPSSSGATNQTQYPAQPVRQFNPNMNGFRPQMIANTQMQPQKVHWQNKMVAQHQHQQQMEQQVHQNQLNGNVYERVPPLHQHSPSSSTQAVASSVMWQEEIKRKKTKMSKVVKSRPYHMIESSCHPPCPNIDVRQIPMESRSVIINQLPPHNINNQTSSSSSSCSSSPSFMEDPSGYLAQQTALLNNTINRQTGANGCTGYICNSPISADLNCQPSPQQSNEIHLPSNMVVSSQHIKQQPTQQPQNVGRPVQQVVKTHQQQQMPQQQSQNYAADSSVSQQPQQCMVTHCQGCMAADSMQQQFILKQESGHQQQMQHHRLQQSHSRSSSTPGTPSSTGTSEDPVTSSTFNDKLSSPSQSVPDTRPIQGGTVSTSNVSPAAGGGDGLHSDPPTPQTPNSQSATSTGAEQRQSNVPTPPRRTPDTSQQQYGAGQIQGHAHREGGYQQKQDAQQAMCCQHAHPSVMGRVYTSGIVTTMASGRTVGSNTITSVLAGRANTATVSINSPSSSTPTSLPNQNTMPITVNVSKSPLEMVQSVVSSIQVPHSQHQQSSSSQMSPQIIKHSPTGLPPGHILVSSGGQLIVTGNNGQQSGGVMAPPPPKIITNQSGMPPISVSPMVTNVTASMTQVIPAVAQQVLGQQTVLVNALPAPFVLQPGVTMTMDGTTVANMQIPQLVAAGNVIQQQIQIDNGSGDPRRAVPALLSPDTKKKGKKRKVASQTVAGMLHIAAQQNQGVVMSQQGFPQQIQMAHSPQGIATGPVMQALTIVPSKTGGPAQIVMNGQAIPNTSLGTQQLITNSQPTQQINLLQPVNLINSATGVVQNFPAIQQFIVPNLGGSMVMNPDGTATILQDTSNIGMQLQIQNVNGQNVLTPVQNSNVFSGGQSILAAGPAGMVIRAPASATSQGKILQQQQHSPGAATQFLSPNSAGQFVVNAAGAQFNGQLSPLVASVSPSQQVTFSTSPQQQIRPNNNHQQDYIQMNGQMGQTLMVPCSLAPANIAVSSSNQQNTTFVQQNTTIGKLQQQTTMVANNQQIQNFQQQQQQASGSQSSQQQHPKTAATLSLDQHNYIISSNDGKQHHHHQHHQHPHQMQAIVVEQRESPKNINYRQSVSTQTAVNQQNSQSVTTNTFCQTSTISASVSSPPDTTTLSPIAAGGQSPPTVDTTTHSGSTDDGLSPAPSNASIGDGSAGRPHSCTMAMVHCISSSEPDSADLSSQCTGEVEWSRRMSGHHNHQSGGGSVAKLEYMDHNQLDRKQTTIPTHVAFAESSTVMSGLHYITTHDKEAVGSSRSYEKQQHRRRIGGGESIVVVEDRHRLHHTALFDDDDEEVAN
ncbi:unnamed protein product [Acanthoscelides obtectus]|uniref:Uncharacterized protein n=1 Tax=Acanthoscelides obtectus TaxID=200917 RepID=A0A9P0KIG1_ACAOB|nr:unnamed protein product [Acanthoscelides obtectus]CAK1639550.1 hypothetical protein AOBTE_LOCUS11241 [Acanthoscelides obtectus]